MDKIAYDFKIGRDSTVYKFFSEGPKGRIRKEVSFRRLYGFVYNLSFGDVNNEGIIDDTVRSDNEDTEKVLVTVAKIAIDFTNKRPYTVLYVEGSTPARTRRYQMGLNRFWVEINESFHVYGYTSKADCELFRSGRNYIAFVAKRKFHNLVF